MTSARPVASAPPQDLTARLQQVLDSVARELGAAGRTDALEQLKAEVERPRASAPIVVVAGEAKRGKSSLINALLGRPGLAPVGIDVVTGTRIVFHHAAQDVAAVRLAGRAETQPIAVDDVAEWASVEANPGNRRGVDALFVGVDVPLLRRLVLVDTPGVGGLEAGHAELTLHALGHADALLFVVDAGAPLTKGELRFLERAAGRIETVLLAIAKSDLYPGWETIARDDAALLAKHAPRFAGCPTVAVSSPLAERALSLSAGPQRDELLREAGVARLADLLEGHVARRSGLLRFANAVRFGHSALTAVERAYAEQVAAAGGDAAVGEALAAEEQRLAALNRERAEWPRVLDAELRRISLKRSRELSRAMRELRLRYDGLAASTRGAELEALPAQLMDEVSALAGRLSETAVEQIRALAERLLGSVDRDATVAGALERIARTELGTDIRLDQAPSQGLSGVDVLSTLISFSSGRSLGALAASIPIVAGAGIPIALAGIGAGGLFAWKMGKGRRELGEQANFRNWMREQLAEVEQELNNDFSLQLIDLHPELRDAVSGYIEARHREVAAALETHRAAAAADADKRRRRQEELRGRLTRVHEVSQAALALLGDMEDARA